MTQKACPPLGGQAFLYYDRAVPCAVSSFFAGPAAVPFESPPDGTLPSGDAVLDALEAVVLPTEAAVPDAPAAVLLLSDAAESDVPAAGFSDSAG